MAALRERMSGSPLLLALIVLASLATTLAQRGSTNVCTSVNYDYNINQSPASAWYYRGSGNDAYCNANPLLKQYLCNAVSPPICSDATKSQTCAAATNPVSCNAAPRVFSVLIDSDCDFIVYCEYSQGPQPVTSSPVIPTPPPSYPRPSPPYYYPPSPPYNPHSSPSSDSGGSSIGVIVGCVAAGGAALIAVVCVALFCFCKHKKRAQQGAGALPTHEPPKDQAASFAPTSPSKMPGYAQPPVVGALGPSPADTSIANVTGDTTSKVYKYEELFKATNGFSMSNLIGQGGFSKVYKGVLADGTTIAVKVLHSDSADGPKNDSFYSEMAIMSRLRHKNLVSMLGYASAGPQRFIVLEFCQGGTLFQALHGHDRLDWAKRLQAALSVAIGLEYLHDGLDPPILHRDIKSANVLFADEKRASVKLSDFGVAKLEDEQAQARTRVMGTRGYMALEYLRSGQVSKYTDVYSLGVLLSELITGRPCTFQMGQDRVTLREWVVGNRQQPLNLIDPALGRNYHPQQAIGLIQLAVECMSDDPRARPLAAQVHQRIEQLIAMQPVMSSANSFQHAPNSGGFESGYNPDARGAPVATSSSDYTYGSPPPSEGFGIGQFQRFGPAEPRRSVNGMTTVQGFTNIHTGR